jgi:hypothetical protein
MTTISLYEPTRKQIAKNDRFKSRLPVRDDVRTVTFHRNPTPSEIQFGYGAIHYRTFSIDEACHKGTRFLKRHLKADDGLRYYR